ncbi:MAG: MaoC family dehydratase N-terminal domain-containing protein [Solirubrobacterales bacterium]|nr:MaoC family dehydratase N-terminal domain-containing protein [Solirubrobacterales bacterium]
MSGAANLAQGTWEQAEALVGTTIAALEGADPVSAADIRRKLEVIGLDCPLHTDPDVARGLGHPDVVSPVSMVRVWAMPAYWRPGAPRVGAELMTTPLPAASVPGEGDTMIATSVRMEHRRPLHPGDRVTATAVLKSVTRKTTRVGPGAFLVVETTYRNQRGEDVTVETVTLLRYQQQTAEPA